MVATQLLQALALLAAYGLLCWACLRPRGGLAGSPGQGGLLIAFASQGGEAERLARHHAELLSPRQGVAVMPLNRVGESQLARARLALFVASTYGEGEAPDNALRFARRWCGEAGSAALEHLHFAVLALGDSNYRQFCGFGLALDRGLRRNGASGLFEPVAVDRLDRAALEQWRQQLVGAGVLEADDPLLPGGDEAGRDLPLACHLAERRHLNPGSPGGPAYHLRLACRSGEAADWQAGDIAMFTVPGGLERAYSIASLPADGSLDLVVRQVVREDGSPGVGSGWLTAGLDPGDPVALRIRRNPAFHAPAPERPMILVGNGTGIAGLRAHLRARELAGGSRNWLVFGERTRRCDSLFEDDIRRWREGGVLTELDRVFSRDGEGPRYVQDLLALRRERLAAWLAGGACVYVCGSLQGMAPAVHRVLLDVLGEQGLEDLTLDGRYRRDVY